MTPIYVNGVAYNSMFLNGVKYNRCMVNGKDYFGGKPKGEVFQITINTNGTNFFWLPTMGYLNGGYNSYNWIVDWGDGSVSEHDGAGGAISGVYHEYPIRGSYKITIMPKDADEKGWLRAFAFYGQKNGTSPFNPHDNAKKIALAHTPLTKNMVCINETDSFICGYMFYAARHLQLDVDFNLPQDFEVCGDRFCAWMFYSISNRKLLLANRALTAPQGLKYVGDYFFERFIEGSGGQVTLNSEFNLPVSLERCGSNFCYRAFSTLRGMSEIFNLPQDLLEVGDNFCYAMFSAAFSNTHNMNDVITIPQKLIKVPNGFCHGMFERAGEKFTIKPQFRLPENLIEVGNDFCLDMFAGIAGSYPSTAHYEFVMHDTFNLPQKILRVGDRFCRDMFKNRKNNKFTMNSEFNLPQGLLSCGEDFVINMFSGCSGENFQINNRFRIPPNVVADTTSYGYAYRFCYGVFRGCSGASFTHGAESFFGNFVMMPVEGGGLINGPWHYNGIFNRCTNLRANLDDIPQVRDVVPISGWRDSAPFGNTPNVIKGDANQLWYVSLTG